MKTMMLVVVAMLSLSGCGEGLADASSDVAHVQQALPGYEVETTYFQSRTDLTQVGSSFLGCRGGYTLTGRRSQFKVESRTPCSGSTPPSLACFLCNGANDFQTCTPIACPVF
jgi:hypothetical protein